MCKLFGVSKQAYHKNKGDRVAVKVAQEAFALEYIHNVRTQAPGIGGMKLWHMYKRDFPSINRLGRDRFENLIHRHGLKVRKKMRKPRTTDSTHGLPVYPNLVREFIPSAINQLWVTDITYIPVWLSENTYCFCYLSMIMDAYSHEIIGWSVGDTLATEHSIRAINKALTRLEEGGTEIKSQLIHHSDRGVQYASRQYTDILIEQNINISMTEKGDPKENAMAERINSTMKNELLKDMRFQCIREVEAAIEIAVDFYNTRRPHMSVDMMTPAEAAKCHGEIVKWWHSYREEAIKNKSA